MFWIILSLSELFAGAFFFLFFFPPFSFLPNERLFKRDSFIPRTFFFYGALPHGTGIILVAFGQRAAHSGADL